MKYKLGGRGHGEKRNALECTYYLKWIDRKVGVREGTSSPRLLVDNCVVVFLLFSMEHCWFGASPG